VGSRRPADFDERLRQLFEARRRGDTQYLIEALRRDRDVSTLPAKWLAEDGITDAIPALVEMLDAADPHARWAAVAALDKLGPPEEARARLVEMARRDDDRYVRGRASAALGRYGGDDLTPLLLSVLADPDWHVSQGAALGLGRRGDLVALGAIRTRLRELRRSPLQWYLHRPAYREAIRDLRLRESEGRAMGAFYRWRVERLQRIHRSLRGLLWWWVVLIALSVLLGWLVGDWHSAWSIVQTIALIIVGLGFVYLIAAGFVELRDRGESD
jgi:hypothetical protein